MTAPLELAKDALCGHLALQVLDRALESTFTDVNFDWLTLYGLDHERFCSFLRGPEAYTVYTGTQGARIFRVEPS